MSTWHHVLVTEERGDLRDRLQRAAVELLDAEGVEAVTIRAVARRVQVSHGAPRRHFPTRALLLATLAQDGYTELLRQMGALDEAAASADRLTEAAHAYLAFAREHPALFDLMTRHDLLENSGLDLRRSSLAALARWDELVLAARPHSSPQDRLLLFTAVHGLAALHSHRALDLLEQDPALLLTAILTPPPTAPLS
jgi:AcrR family transcriptional regulator